MTVSVHNPDQYMASLRQIIAQGRKRIGLLVGAGAPAGIFPPGSDKPLIPAVAGLTDMVIALWLGHESVETTQVYVHADLRLKEKALARMTAPASKPGRSRPEDKLLAFLEAL